MRHNRRTIALFATVLLLIGAGWLAVFAYEQGFTNKWRRRIINELEKNGIAAEIGRLTIDPFNGLTARDVLLFDATHRAQRLAEIDHISLDVDLAKLIRGEDFLRTVDLRHASVALPVNPDDPNSETLQINDLNARLHFDGDSVDVAQAEGVVSGVRLKVRGSLDLPQRPHGSPEEIERQRRERKRQLKEIKQRRGVIRDLVEFLDKFKSTSPDKALIEVEINGPLADFPAVRATAVLQAGNLQCGDFLARTVRAEATLSEGTVSLRKCEIEDSFGKLSAQASWRVGDDKGVQFWMDSSADAHALLKALWPERSLGEIVFYQPPHIKADGRILTAAPATPNGWPLDIVARVDTRRFTTHGVIFDGFHGDFCLRGEEFHARNIQLEHHSGSANAQFMLTTAGGFRYHLKWNMELNAALPFLSSEVASEWMADFEFGPDSFVGIEALGAGASLDPATWTGSAQLDLRNFSHRDVAIKSATAKATLTSGKQVLRDVVVRRPEGEVSVSQIILDPEAQTIAVRGLVSTTQPHPLARNIHKSLARDLQPYSFAIPPRVELDGVFNLREPSKMDYLVKITAPGRCSMSMNGKVFDFASASGTVRRSGEVLHLDFTGRGAAGMAYGGLTCDREPALAFVGRLGLGSLFGKVRSYTITARADDSVRVAFAGKHLPVQFFQAVAQIEGESSIVNTSARIVGGAVEAAVTFPDIFKSSEYRAEVRGQKIDFSRLVRIFDPSKVTQGEVSGYLNFTGVGSDPASIRGAGRIVLNDGDVFAIPWLGPLSKLLTVVLPVESLAYSTAREAAANVTVMNGSVSTKDFEAQTRSFRLKIDGVVDYINDKLDLTARMNARGAPGILLYPVSKLLEYEAQGSLSDPGWKPKHLGIPFVGDRKEDRGRQRENEPPIPAPPPRPAR